MNYQYLLTVYNELHCVLESTCQYIEMLVLASIYNTIDCSRLVFM